MVPPALDSLQSVFVVAAFGSGLIPSVWFANKQAFSTLLESQRNPVLREDMLRQNPSPGSEAMRGSAQLLCARWLGYPEPLRVCDAVAAVSRIRSADELWLEAKVPSIAPANGGSSRKLLRQAQFEGCLRSCKPSAWPVSDGKPIGGAELHAALGGNTARLPLSDAAIDASWFALSGGSSYVSYEEVQRQLARWRPDDASFELRPFEQALLAGRANILFGYAVLFGLQALVLAVFVLNPLVS